MAKQSKFFRVAVEGATTDGRKIDRAWITQMAKNFNPNKYGARIWMEHIRGTLPDSPFRAYGDVTAVKAEEIDFDGEKRLALFAQIKPTPDLVAMLQKNQKIYTSIEISEKFADTGEAYLTGLGVTDSPASLGTEVLSFAAQNPAANIFTARKQHPENVFSAALETVIEFDEVDTENKFTKAMTELIAKFTTKKATDDDRFATIVDGFSKVLEQFEKLPEQFADISKLQALEQALEEQTKAFAALQQQLGKEPEKHAQRPIATGGNGQQTDC